MEDEGDVHLHRVAAAGGGAPERIIGGTRQVTAFSASEDGASLAFAATDDISPAEVFVCRADGSGERQLTDLNREWKAERRAGAPGALPLRARGLSVDGWVMRPPGRGGPAVPRAAQRPRRARRRSTGTASSTSSRCTPGAGYAVVFPNPRGSQGYGEAFARAITQDWGNDDYADVMAGLDEALPGSTFSTPGASASWAAATAAT